MESKTEINSLLEFIEVMSKSEEEKEPLKKYYFRGENNVFPRRVPSIYRSNENKAIYQRLVNEGSREYYLELFEELGWSISNFGHKMFEQMIEVQHYGAVTNVLDVSINPLVALFFACYGSDKTDGKVYVYSVNEVDEEHYFNRNVAIMTALNFVDRRLIDSFINFFQEIRSINRPHADDINGIFFDSKDDLHTYTVEDIMERITSLMETGEFELYRLYTHKNNIVFKSLEDAYKFQESLHRSIHKFIPSDVKFWSSDPLHTLNQLESFRIPFTMLRFDHGYENWRDKMIYSDREYENETKEEILSFVAKLFKPDDKEIEGYNSLNDGGAPLDFIQSALIDTIRKIMTNFLKQLNEYSGLNEEMIYPFEVYNIITKSYFVKASKINERIKNQRGAFIIPSYISTVSKSIVQVQEELNQSIESIGLCKEITIPSKSKAKILKQLKLIGIDEGFIYPEIANIAKAVLEKYKE